MRHWRLGVEGEYRTADGRHVQFGLFGSEDGVVRHFSSEELEGMIGRGEESGEAGFAEYESRGTVTFAEVVRAAVSHPGTGYGVLEEGAAVRALVGLEPVTFPGTVWGVLQQGGGRYCIGCARAWVSAMTTAQRGYGKAHQRARARLAPVVATGRQVWWRCGHVIAKGEAWDLGHDDRDRNVYRGPEHRACNRAVESHVPWRVERTSRRW